MLSLTREPISMFYLKRRRESVRPGLVTRERRGMLILMTAAAIALTLTLIAPDISWADAGVVYRNDPMARVLFITSPDGKYVAELAGDAGTTTVLEVCRRDSRSKLRKVYRGNKSVRGILTVADGICGLSWMPNHPHTLVFGQDSPADSRTRLRMWNGGKKAITLVAPRDANELGQSDDRFSLTRVSRDGSVIYYTQTVYLANAKHANGPTGVNRRYRLSLWPGSKPLLARDKR
jgi:hypothetical protein